jgi:hypothetical protein
MWTVILLANILTFSIRTPSVFWRNADGKVIRRVDYQTGVYQPLFRGELESLTQLDPGYYHAYTISIINKTITIPRNNTT